MGRLLKYEITAPLDFIRIKWRPHHLQGRHPPRRSRHLRGAITVPSSCARQPPTFKDNLPHQVAFQQKRCFSLISLMRTGQKSTSRLTTRTSHRARHDAEGVFLIIHTQVSPSCTLFQSTGLLPGRIQLQFSSRHTERTTLETRNTRRSNWTTAHDETRRARRQDFQTAPCASTARRRHRLARTDAIRGHQPDCPKSAHNWIFSWAVTAI